MSKTDPPLASDVTETLIARIRERVAELRDIGGGDTWFGWSTQDADAVADHLSALHQERDEAQQALGDAARELNIAGPVAHRIQKYKELSRELVDQYRTRTAEAEAENQRLELEHLKTRRRAELAEGRAEVAEAGRDEYRAEAEAAAAENTALRAQLETAQQDILTKLAANYRAKGYREPGLLTELRAALMASPKETT